MIISLQDIAKIRNAISNLNLNSPNDFKLYQELSYQFINLTKKFKLDMDSEGTKNAFLDNFKCYNKLLKAYYGSRIWKRLKPNEQLCILYIFYVGDNALIYKTNRFYINITNYAKTSKSMYLRKAIIEILNFHNISKNNSNALVEIQNSRQIQAIMLSAKGNDDIR
jgi:hypothetical protein